MRLLKTMATIFVGLMVELVVMSEVYPSGRGAPIGAVIVAVATPVVCALVVYRINRRRPTPVREVRAAAEGVAMRLLTTMATIFVGLMVELVAFTASFHKSGSGAPIGAVIVAVATPVVCALVVYRINRRRPTPVRFRSDGDR